MSRIKPIVLLTDFGEQDGFVGVMKGVIHRITSPAIPVLLDLTHQISPYSCIEAAWRLYTHFSYFPEGTVFLVVVDPGVGSNRRAVIAETKGYTFVAPDNGVLDLVLGTPARFTQITESTYIPAPEFSTFHGRDIFAPAAAYLSKGIPADELGKPATRKARLNIPSLRPYADGIAGEVLFFDRFGNAFTNLPLEKKPVQSISFRNTSLPLASHFAAAAAHQLTAVRGSTGYLELFVNQGNAQEQFSIQRGEAVRLHY